MLKAVFCIALGSSIGGVLRFLVSEFFRNCRWMDLPLGTIVVNLLGCLMIGVFYALFEKSGTRDAEVELFLIVGVCGGFTTFSTFINDQFQMMRVGNFLRQLTYLVVSVAGGYGCLYAGYAGMRHLM